MRAVMKQEKRIAIALASMALMLTGLLLWEWDQGIQLRQELASLRNIPVTAVPAQKIMPEHTLPDSGAGFPDFLTRPLFSANRRPAPTAGKGGVSAMKKGQFVLVGVLITPQQRSALLRDVQTKKIETVALAGVVRGITLGEVEPSRVVLRQDAETEELMLNVQVGSKPTIPPQTQGVPPAPPPVAAPALPPAQPASAAPVSARSASGTSPPASSPVGSSKPAESASAPKPQLTVPQPLPKK